MLISQKKQYQQGVSLIITFFIMTIILAVVLSISVILFNKIKIVDDIKNSVSASYAADLGIEKTVYFDAKQIPNGATRGFCNICNVCPTNQNDSNGSTATHCNQCALSGSDCGVASCTNCQLTYTTTTLDGSTDTVSASVAPDALNPSLSDFNITSTGVYNSVTRQTTYASTGL